MRRYQEDYTEEEWDDLCERFADPGGNSCLFPADHNNPRNLPCPTCHKPNRLTQKDRNHGYQCDECADRAERGYDY